MMARVVAGGELEDSSEVTADFGLERIIAGIDVLLGE